MTTICANCKHLIHLEPENSPRGDVWYNLVCEVCPTKEFDVVTGKTENGFKYCRDVNNGHCPIYDEKGK